MRRTLSTLNSSNIFPENIIIEKRKKIEALKGPLYPKFLLHYSIELLIVTGYEIVYLFKIGSIYTL